MAKKTDPKTSGKPAKAAGKTAARPAAAREATPRKTAPKPRSDEIVLLSGGNPQIAKGYGDAPVQAYIAAMPGWKSDLGRRLDALIERTVPGVYNNLNAFPDCNFFCRFYCFLQSAMNGTRTAGPRSPDCPAFLVRNNVKGSFLFSHIGPGLHY
jgi:hypothetical protein